MFGNMGDMMKKVQKMKTAMSEMQEKLLALRIEGASGGGLVKATVDGEGTIKEVHIDPSLLDPSEGEVLEDLLVAACHDAQEKAKDKAAEEMNKATGGFSLPKGMKLPF
jgi:DNA-binding YbaB/EbfC family protein